VAREFGTSQAPIREALRGLEALGVVQTTPFRGTRVRRPNLDELLDAYVVRTDLEMLGARLAISRMTEADASDLRDLVGAMQEAALSGDRHALAAADAHFHERIIELAGNKTLHRLWSSLEPLLRTYITLVIPGSDLTSSAHLHDPILDALEKGDKRAVSQAVRQHFQSVRSMLSRFGEEPSPTRTDMGQNGRVSKVARNSHTFSSSTETVLDHG
jgi:DNA-binding GntR family transcriptional regulator